jgi:predicted protein tyrosine phosphatase
VQRSQVIGAARQALLELLEADLQVTGQLLAQVKAIGQKPRKIQVSGHRLGC